MNQAVPREEPMDTGTRYLVVGIICVGSFLSPLSLASVNMAIPSLARALDADAVSVALLPTLFLLSNVALMLPFAKLADNVGRKRVYATGVAINALASLAAWGADNIEWILLCRLLQGAGSAMTFGTSLAIIASVFPPRERGLPLGLNTAAIYIGLTAAPALGGLVTDSFGWRAVFLLPLPLAAALVGVIVLFLREEWRHERYSAFDWTGSVIFALWTIALVVGLTGLPEPASIGALAVSVGLLALFVWQQSRHDEPLIRVQLFRDNRLFSRSLATSALMYAGTYPLTFLLSLYLQYIREQSALQAGTVILMQAAAMALLAPFAGKLSDRVEPRIISTIGCLGCVLGFGLLTQLGIATSPGYISLSLFCIGIGFGLFSTPNNNAVLGAVNPREVGVASATVNLARVSGNLVGISLINLLVQLLLGNSAITPDQYPQLLETVHLAMYLSLAASLLACLFSATRGRMPAALPPGDV